MKVNKESNQEEHNWRFFVNSGINFHGVLPFFPVYSSDYERIQMDGVTSSESIYIKFNANY